MRQTLAQLLPRQRAPARYVDSRVRLWVLLALFAAAACAILVRLMVLEVTGGERFRQLATQPRQERSQTPGLRGRILSRDGAVLAQDESVIALAVHYRWLEEPSDIGWLRRQARAELTPSQRRDPQQVNAAIRELRVTRIDLHRRLAQHCGLTYDVWRTRANRIQRQVQRIAESVNRRHQQRYEFDAELAAQQDSAAADSWWSAALEHWTGGQDPSGSRRPRPRTFSRIVVAEEQDYHVLVDRISAELAQEIEAQPAKFPGMVTQRQTVRSYPQQTQAAHVVGYVRDAEAGDSGSATADGPQGVVGIERLFDPQLRGTAGTVVECTDADGQLLSTFVETPSQSGTEVRLTLDLRLQQRAERLLDEALARASALDVRHTALHGGAAVLMDVRNGEVLALATAPRFDPNWFATGPSTRAAAALQDPAQPLFERATRMAVPPGSVFKVVTSAALLDRGIVDPREPFHCRGYYQRMDRERCALFQLNGRGHGSLDLIDALAVSCNVYYYRCADTLGERDLFDWARRFGLGTATGIQLPGESAGNLPDADRRQTDRNLFIGQGEITTTPLQMARVAAAVANGGKLVVPRLILSSKVGEHPSTAETTSTLVRGFTPQTREWLHRGMVAVVADPQGTAHRTVHQDRVPIAGKTGTAETGRDQLSHAWFIGYAPVESPVLAVAVCLEHSGSGGAMAGPVAKHLLLAADEFGYLNQTERSATGPPRKD